MLEVENLHTLHQSNEILHIFVELFIYIILFEDYNLKIMLISNHQGTRLPCMRKKNVQES